MGREFKCLDADTRGGLEQDLNDLKGDWTLDHASLHGTAAGTRYFAIVSRQRSGKAQIVGGGHVPAGNPPSARNHVTDNQS